jgi:hypothetical protein
MPRPGGALIIEIPGEFLVAVEELLCALPVVIVGPEEIEPVHELTLHPHLQRVVAFPHAGGVRLVHVSILRKGLQQGSQRDLLLVPKLSREL